MCIRDRWPRVLESASIESFPREIISSRSRTAASAPSRSALFTAEVEGGDVYKRQHEIFSSNFWKGSALGRPILGTKQTIRAFDRDLVERYYRQYYTPSNILITAAGNLNHRRLVQLAEDHFSDLKPRRKPALESTPRPHAPLVFKNKNSLEQVHVYLGVPSIPMPHESRFACYILNAILGGGMSSRLFQNIRERQGLAYAVYSELSPYSDTGCMSCLLYTSPGSAER